MDEKNKKSLEREKFQEEVLVRILSTDIPGNNNLVSGFTKIKGISWSMANAICGALKLDKKRKIKELNEKEIEKISEFIKNTKLPEWILNRRKDFESGKSLHLLSNDLDYAKENDIRFLKKIRCYRGWRHASGQPVRGQRTKSHFRKGASLGVSKKGGKK